MPSLPSWRSVHTIVFDFDGVFTNNMVSVDQNGVESVLCSRADGLALDLLRRFKVYNDWDLDLFILSKETNRVVNVRAEKLKLRSEKGINDKRAFIINYLEINNKSPSGLIYLGNDLNDLKPMSIPGVFSVAPKDAHPTIKSIANYLSSRVGGDSFVRDFVEQLLEIDSLDQATLFDLL